MNKWIVVHCCPYDGIDLHGPFDTEEAAEIAADKANGRPRRVVRGGSAFADGRRFVAAEACKFGGITIYGWFPTRQAAEAFCHRQAAMSSPGVQFAAAAVS